MSIDEDIAYRRDMAHNNRATLLKLHSALLEKHPHPLLFLLDCSDHSLGREVGAGLVGEGALRGLEASLAGGTPPNIVPSVIHARPWNVMHDSLVEMFPYLEDDLRQPPPRDECHVLVVAKGDADVAVLPVESQKVQE